MPTPKKGEHKKTFIKRCIPYMYKEEPESLTSKDKKNKQAYAICNSMFDKKNKKKKNENVLFFDDFVNETKDKVLQNAGVDGYNKPKRTPNILKNHIL